ncbi:2-C-methyl-D-erythritol 4-phosphate cytidylyltransferase [Keratinibaculum paraultunense]|uniref:2-C-methyl-D-erythritol 4-phosphate cytidylyltransferase n=1 Tax=Keratinibaculum paraultunense TaxID=1278232 RepID=A0A4R3KVV0_9FIRM|nr:2-C-methyl-D-erythritol 4-phosphate cytidylyltransferase [Keratinibaculum paraultunense]QQY79124.1 2-C-methyl-D-erythritol 4-phosphate cytidylyltransferase [Keratinibaculum paraultunense]TCS88509.1 2-C-methyl-D-erythritol 4-phosphate cytidylyltransferase [Keratinibaculum paraultunense]
MNIGIILAGGIGSRMGIVDKPKQFIDIYGKPIIVYTLETFDNHPEIDYIGVVCLDEWMDDLKILLRKYEINKVKWLIKGGMSRQESVYNAIIAISKDVNDDDILVIHDSVRPLVSHKIISNNISSAKQFGATDTVIPSTDTIIKSLDGLQIHEVPNRSELYIGQTPQSFKFELIKRAHETAIESNKLNSTDDCQLVLDLGEKVKLVMGDKLNFKITSFDDLLLLKAIIKLGKTEMV